MILVVADLAGLLADESWGALFGQNIIFYVTINLPCETGMNE